jgi:hypothetical protein
MTASGTSKWYHLTEPSLQKNIGTIFLTSKLLIRLQAEVMTPDDETRISAHP